MQVEVTVSDEPSVLICPRRREPKADIYFPPRTLCRVVFVPQWNGCQQMSISKQKVLTLLQTLDLQSQWDS